MANNCCCESSDANCLACNRAKYIQALINYSKTVQMPYSCPSPCCTSPCGPPPSCCPPPTLCCSPPPCPSSACCQPSCCACPTKVICCTSPCPPPCPAPCPASSSKPCPPCDSFWRKLLRAILKFIADILWLLHLLIMFIIRRIENMYNFYYAFKEANIFLQIAFVISFAAFITSMIVNYRSNSPLICPSPIVIERCPVAISKAP